jgi:hypothetical protein
MDSDRFVEFMRNKYFPSVFKGQTRVGQVTNLILLRDMSETDEGRNEFFLHVGYVGLETGKVRVKDEKVRQTFETVYGAERLGVYDEVVTWSEDKGS